MTTATETRAVKRRKAGKNTVVTDGCNARDGNGDPVRDTEKTLAGNGKGDREVDAEKQDAQEERQKAENSGDTEVCTDDLCRSLQSLERERRFALKQCTAGTNSITAYVAWRACGFHTGIESEEDRKERWKKATKLIREIDGGDRPLDAETRGAAGGDRVPATENNRAAADDSGDERGFDADRSRVAGIVRVSHVSRKLWADYEEALMAKMKELAGKLPVAPWFDHPDCRGISLGILATIVGETGNLSNYPNPAKLWRRLFGAPITKDGKTMMPSRWRLEGGLTKEEWEEAGYSPQRHATMQQLKENIVRQNGPSKKHPKPGPYRLRYEEAKERTRETHPEWWTCETCDGKGKVKRKKCSTCKGTGECPGHPHNHARLLAAKRFVRDLWNKWHGTRISKPK